MTAKPMHRRGRCPVCLSIQGIRYADGLIRMHGCKGSEKPPLPAVVGQELPEGPFPEEVSGVIDGQGRHLIRTTTGWRRASYPQEFIAFILGPNGGPYMVKEVTRVR